MSSSPSKNSFIVAVTGASGAHYAEKFLNEIVKYVDHVDLVLSETALKVVRYELAEESRPEIDILKVMARKQEHEKIRVYKNNDLFAPLASGSSAGKRMIIVPCSMGTMGRIAGGMSSTLIERTADVVLKEKGKLVICPRETPLSGIHLENMSKLDRYGAHIIPAMPGFYQKPKSMEDLINFVVGKLLEGFGFEHQLYPAWRSELK